MPASLAQPNIFYCTASLSVSEDPTMMKVKLEAYVPVSQNIQVEDQFTLTGTTLSSDETATTGDIPFADAG